MSSVSRSGNNEIADQYASQRAEKERLIAEHEAEMDRLKESQSIEKEAVKDRFESSIQNERLQSYENLRNTKRQFNKEEKALSTAGEERLKQKSDEYRQQEMTITKEGTAKVEDARKKQAALEEYQRQQATEATALTRSNHGRSAQAIIKDSDDKIQQLRDDKTTTLERRRGEHGVAIQQIDDHYDQRQLQVMKQHEVESKRIYDGTQREINESLVANAQRLDQHRAKEGNPFYQLNRVDSDFADKGDHYSLVVSLPEYEKRGFRVQIAGNEVQLSGIRNSQNRVELEPGHGVSTNSYQTFSERFQFDSPVDAKAMQMTDYGDYIEYIIPKFGAAHRYGEENIQNRIRKQTMAMAEEVDFKDTIPLPTIVSDKGSSTLG